MIHASPSTLVAMSAPVRKPSIIRRVFAALYRFAEIRRRRRLLPVLLGLMAILFMLVAAFPLKANLSRTATGARVDPAPHMSPANMQSMSTANNMTIEFTDPIVPADSIANTERGAGWGPLRLTDW